MQVLALCPIPGSHNTPGVLQVLAARFVTIPGQLQRYDSKKNSADNYEKKSVVIDAVGFGAASAAYREGAGIAANSPVTNGEYAFVRKTNDNGPIDTDNDAADFVFVSNNGASYDGIQSQLGAPGPENLASPINRNNGFAVALSQPNITNAANRAPNSARATSDAARQNPDSPLGTLALHRTLTNT